MVGGMDGVENRLQVWDILSELLIQSSLDVHYSG